MISPEEWEILSNDELTEKTLALKKHEAWLAKYETSVPKCAANSKKDPKAKKKKKKKTIKKTKKESDATEKGITLVDLAIYSQLCINLIVLFLENKGSNIIYRGW